MATLDAFNTDAFNTTSLTNAVNKLPFKPMRIGQLGIFQPQGIPTTQLFVEEREGVLYLIRSKSRSEGGDANVPVKRKARSFVVSHFPVQDSVLADDVQNLRAFGSENALMPLTTLVNDRLTTMRQSVEAMHEWLMAGALAGVVKDGDGTTTLYNLFTEFGTSEQTKDFDFAGAGDPLPDTIAVKRLVETALGAAPYDHIHALCSDGFWDAFIGHANVKTAYERWRDGEFLRSDMRAGFPFGGVIWENYRGSIGGNDFIAANTARFFPVGVPNLFKMYYAPANYAETVNTIGRAVYAKQERMKFDKGVEMEVQTNALPLCHRPRCLVKGTIT